MKLMLAFQRVLEQTSVWLWSRFFGSLTGTLAQVPLNSSPFNPRCILHPLRSLQPHSAPLHARAPGKPASAGSLVLISEANITGFCHKNKAKLEMFKAWLRNQQCWVLLDWMERGLEGLAVHSSGYICESESRDPSGEDLPWNDCGWHHPMVGGP